MVVIGLRASGRERIPLGEREEAEMECDGATYLRDIESIIRDFTLGFLAEIRCVAQSHFGSIILGESMS
jgi:hypothetical protein